MTTVTFLQHQPTIAPGGLLKTIEDAGGTTRIIRAWEQDDWKVCHKDVLVVLGGRMNAFASHDFPHLERVCALLKERTEAGAPTLGICLGHQLLARAMGGEVTVDAPEGPETGVYSIFWNKHAPALNWLPSQAYEHHNDAVTKLPPQAQLWANSKNYIQAYRINNSVGLQFHPEVDSDLLQGWYREADPNLSKAWLEDYASHSDSLTKLQASLGAWLANGMPMPAF